MKIKPLLVFLFCLGISQVHAQREVDSILLVVKQSNDTIVKVNALNKAAFLLRSANPDSCLLLSIESERLSSLIDFEMGIANAKMGKGIAYNAMGNYYKALNLFLESKLTYEKLDRQPSIASSLNNIGRVYNFIEDYDRALDYYQQSAILFSELKDNETEGSIINNIGYIYKLKGEYEKSLQTLNRSLQLAQELNNEKSIIYPIYNIGSVYMMKNEFDSAKAYLNQAMILSRQLRNQYILSLTLVDLGQMYLKKDQLDSAESTLLEAFNVASSTGLRSEKKDVAKYLSEVYERMQLPNKALDYYKLYKETNDSLFNRNLAKQMAFRDAEYEFDRKQVEENFRRDIEQKEQEKSLNDAIWIRNSLIAGLFAMVLITYLLYMNFSRKQMANKALKNLNSQVEQQAEELRQANHEITVMNSNLESTVNKRTEELKRRNEQLKEYLSSNSHIVRAPLARILGLVDFYDPNDNTHLKFIMDSLQKSALELDNALRDINDKLSDNNKK